MPKKKRPTVLKGRTYKLKTECGNFWLRINKDDNGDVVEVMPSMGKAGNCPNAKFETIGHLISEAFKFEGITQDERTDMAKQMIGIHCPQPFSFEGKRYKSCIDLMGHKILEEIEEKKERKEEEK